MQEIAICLATVTGLFIAVALIIWVVAVVMCVTFSTLHTLIGLGEWWPLFATCMQ